MHLSGGCGCGHDFVTMAKCPHTIWPGSPVLVIEPGKFAWMFYQQLQVSQVSSS